MADAAVRLVEADGFSDVDVADAVAVSKAEDFFILDVVADAAQAAPVMEWSPVSTG